MKRDLHENENEKKNLIKEMMIKDADILMPCLKAKSRVVIKSSPEVS